MGYLFNRRQVQQNYDKNKKKPRILYTGSGAHYDVGNKTGGKDDMSDVVDVMIETGAGGNQPSTVIDLTEGEPVVVRIGKGSVDFL